MKKKLFLSALAMCAFMFSMTAQNAPTATATPAAKAAPAKKEISAAEEENPKPAKKPRAKKAKTEGEENKNEDAENKS